ncbi:hypothetical protein [Acinetobacter sichuanensis]|uniref:Uncharacterized protein n=2 Tax=Acinetobacter sichuanensis TaxID=2136183 RepID=A0A371YJA6_9GAMM|nr:hypothetical protein [Acinetobacter sichuanensis]RFC81516.1 hypothetical protein C9E89_021440 [Acinetobacter sichuanensis]
MTEQNVDLNISDYSKKIGDLVSKIQSGKLSKQELKEAKKSLQEIQKLVTDSIESFNNILPDLTAAEKRVVDTQKFAIGEAAINQIFDESENILSEYEQKQFSDLLNKILKSASKREQNKIFKGSDNLKEALYLHSDNARREKLNK